MLAFTCLAGFAGLTVGQTVSIIETPSTVTMTMTATPIIASDAPQFADNATFASAVLNSTNVVRQEYNASAVSWNRTLATFASSYLLSMGILSPDNGSECNFSHSGGSFGENLALGCGDVTGCVGLWADEVKGYDYNEPGFSETTGHFTQLVWKNTTTMGCGCRLCGTRGWFLVCEYWPRGNVVGEFGSQVGRQVNVSSSTKTTSSGRLWVPKYRHG